MKKEIKIQKELTVKRKESDKREKKKKSGIHFPKVLCRVHAAEVAN